MTSSARGGIGPWPPWRPPAAPWRYSSSSRAGARRRLTRRLTGFPPVEPRPNRTFAFFAYYFLLALIRWTGRRPLKGGQKGTLVHGRRGRFRLPRGRPRAS